MVKSYSDALILFEKDYFGVIRELYFSGLTMMINLMKKIGIKNWGDEKLNNFLNMVVDFDFVKRNDYLLSDSGVVTFFELTEKGKLAYESLQKANNDLSSKLS